MDDFDDAGGIAGRWLNVSPGASPDAAASSARCSGVVVAPKPPRPRNSSAAAPAQPPSQRNSGAATVVSACAAGADDRALTAMLESLSLPHLETLASIALDVLSARRAAQDSAVSAPRQPAPRQSAPPHRKPRAPAPAPSSRGGDELDELETGIAGRWLQVPAGGTLPESESRATEAPKPTKKVTAPPKKPPRSMGDLD